MYTASRSEMPPQIKIVLVAVWLQFILGGVVCLALFRSVHTDSVRNVLEFFVGLVLLFQIFVIYRLATRSRWAYRYVLICTCIGVARFLWGVAMNQNIPPVGYFGFALSAGVIVFLLTPQSKEFYKRRG